MAATEAQIAFGTKLLKGGATVGASYSDLGLEITNISAPGWTREAIDATHHQSPNGYSEAIMSGVKRQTPFTVEINWLPGDTGDLKDNLELDEMVFWKVEFPDGSSVACKMGLTGFEPGDMTVDGKMSATLTMTPSGEPVWTAGA